MIHPSIYRTKLLACPSQHEKNPINNNISTLSGNILVQQTPSGTSSQAKFHDDGLFNYLPQSRATNELQRRLNKHGHALYSPEAKQSSACSLTVKVSCKNRPIFYLHCNRLYIKLAKVRTSRGNLFIILPSRFYSRRVII